MSFNKATLRSQFSQGEQQESHPSSLDKPPYFQPDSNAGIQLVDSLNKLSLTEACIEVVYGLEPGLHRGGGDRNPLFPTSSDCHTPPSPTPSPPPAPRQHINSVPVPGPDQEQQEGHHTWKYASQYIQAHYDPTARAPEQTLSDALSSFQYYETPVMVSTPALSIAPPPPMQTFDLSAIASRFPSAPVGDSYRPPHLPLNDVAAQFISKNINPGGGFLREASWNPPAQQAPRRRSQLGKDKTGLAHIVSRLTLEDQKAQKARVERMRATRERVGKLRTPASRHSVSDDDAVPTATPALAHRVPALSAKKTGRSPSPAQRASESARRRSKADKSVKALEYGLARISLQDPKARKRLSAECMRKRIDSKEPRPPQNARVNYLDMERDEENTYSVYSVLSPTSAPNLPGFGPKLVACVAAHFAQTWGYHSDPSTFANDDMMDFDDERVFPSSTSSSATDSDYSNFDDDEL